MLFRSFQPFLDHIDLLLGGLAADLGLFLEGVRHIDRPGKLDRVNTAKRVALPVLDDFEHSGPAETLERFGIDKLAALLGQARAKPKLRRTSSGHARLNTTEIYTHVNIQKLIEVHRLTQPDEAARTGWPKARLVIQRKKPILSAHERTGF